LELRTKPAAIATQTDDVASRQATPITLQRQRGSYSVAVRRGALTTLQMRRLSREGVPGICKETLTDEALALDFTITNPVGKSDAQTLYSTMLLEQANDGEGFPAFVSRMADDILTSIEGGYFEIVLNGSGVPLAIYNVDCTTIFRNPAFPETNPDEPWEQRIGESDPVLFSRAQMAHAYWKPVVQWGDTFRNRCPIELAYFYICILAAGDDWNLELISDPFPAGVLALPGATVEEANAFQASWNNAIQGGQLRDLAVIYGMELGQAQHVKFTRPPTDMAFEITNHWYTSLVAAAFEMSILDISILTKVSTKAGADSQERKSTQQGLRKLRRVIQAAIERWILPEGYNFNWTVPKVEDEATLAGAAAERARATYYYVQAFGPEVGREVAEREGILTTDETEAGKPLARVKSTAIAQAEQMLIRADLRGYLPYDDWEYVSNTMIQQAAIPPADLWGQDLFDWVIEQYDAEMAAAVEIWMEEVQDDPQFAAALFAMAHKGGARRAVYRSYLAGKQRDSGSFEAAVFIAAMAFTLTEMGKLDAMISENNDRFQTFITTLREEGADYGGRVAWRADLYVGFPRRAFLMGVTSMADPDHDSIVISHGESEEPCEVCPTRWGEYTVDEYHRMGGPPPTWCEGFDNCTCRITVRRNIR